MRQKRLLVIEDDFDLGDMLVTFFVAKGYDVLHAQTGAEGIALARAKFPNLILLDVMLPDMEGFAVCRALRTNTLTKYIPITFLTQRDARADKVAGLQLGADDYVTKPFDIEELRLRVDRSIERATRDHLHEVQTGLPTNQLIVSEYYAIAESEEVWHKKEFCIEGFEAFRDGYGFLTANEAIVLAGNIITKIMGRFGTHNDFIGITADNNFVIFTQTDIYDRLENELTEEFANRVRALYFYTDVDQGYVLLNAGTADEKQAPLMHFTVRDYEPPEE